MHAPKVGPVQMPIEYLLMTYNTFSPNSRWLASYSDYTGLGLWDLSKYNPFVATIALRDHADRISCVAFSEDSTLLATGSYDKTINVYRLYRGKSERLAALRQHRGEVRRIVFSPSGRWLVTTNSNRVSVLWDLLARSIQSTAVTIDASTLIEGRFYFHGGWLILEQNKDHYRVIPIETDLVLQSASRVAGRNFNHSEWEEFFPGIEYGKTFVSFPEGEPLPEPQEIF